MARLALDDAAWSGPWRKRSVAEKSLLCLGLLTLAISSPGPIFSVAVLATAIVAALLLARVPRGTYFAAIAAPATFLVLSLPALAVSIGAHPVDAVWSMGPVHLESAGIDQAVAVGARSVAAMAAMLLLPLTTPMVDLLDGMRRLRVPESLIDIAALTYRMLFSLLDSVASIREAQTARLGYAGSTQARRSFGLVGAAVLHRAWLRSQRLEQGLLGRGYIGSLATLREPTTVDRPFVLLTVLMLLTLTTASVLSR